MLGFLLFAAAAHAQIPRQDVIWARSTAGAPIVLDGNLNEAVWAQAETKVMECIAGYCQRAECGDGGCDYDLYGPSPFKGNRNQGPSE